ncbi:helix-turn-helix transcriptional regulator [Lactobacillus delbrueckii]|uniref:helix-turn-helix domain-containing protein n=1 Tax=Lactobacillus delbrueckii TaxID=1584 RepID=UPI0023E3C194|nr:helix-turn-helix transcriptional regulator [Lactobacillus delbrueckii]MDF4028895.1 helix-turn-helix transcriptional regulator [Lactobacillus delbrueckii]
MANRIKQLRKENGLTLKELSREVGIPASTISQYENERRKIPDSALKTLSDFFEVPENYILGAWSEKEVIELMSSSLLDNYERLSELDREYKEIYEGDPFKNHGLFGSMSLITEPAPSGYIGIGKKGSIEYRTVQERAIQKEILSNDYMALAFSIISLVYFDSVFGNSVLKPEGDSETDRYKLANEQVNDLMSNLKKSAGQNTGKDFLKSYFQKHCFKSVLSSLVVRKLMAEKVEPETMALVLVNSIEGEVLEMEIRAYHYKEIDEILFPDETESQSTNIDIDDLIQETNSLYDRIDELQKENYRLKAELASKR